MSNSFHEEVHCCPLLSEGPIRAAAYSKLPEEVHCYPLAIEAAICAATYM